MKPVGFALSVNLAIMVIGFFLIQFIPFLGGIVCLLSYPSIFYLGWIWSRYPVKVSVNAAGDEPVRKSANAKRQSRLKTLE